MDRTQTRGLYSIALPNGRSADVSAEQLRRIARGMGEHYDEPRGPDRSPPIVEAIEALPAERRADALAVALLRFGDKRDLESISHSRGLSAWQVWQLEEAFRQALGRVAASGSDVQAELAAQLPESPTASLMSEEMLANAIAHGDRVDLEAEHEASLRTARDL